MTGSENISNQATPNTGPKDSRAAEWQEQLSDGTPILIRPIGKGDAALGLGLPLTRQFIEAHGGTATLESAVGKGTRVTLVIPRAPS